MTGESNKDQKQDKEITETPTGVGSVEKVAAEPSAKPVASETKPEKTPPQPKKSNKKSGSLLLLILFVVVLTALAAGGYFGWRFWDQYSSSQEQRISTLESTAAEQNSQVQTLTMLQAEKIENQDGLLATISASQEAIQQRLDTHTQRLRALAGTSRDDWLLAEARYLLRLASQRLLVERGTDGARALLESADDILLSIDDDGALPVRNAIANEIIALKLAKTVDRQGLYLQLAAIKNQIQALPLIPFRPTAQEPNFSTSEVSTPIEKAPWYLSIWKSITGAFSNLDRFIQIREHDQAPELLVSEKQQLQTINHLMLLFEQAQFALLHEEEMIYRNSLQEAIKWWAHFYSHYDEFEIIHSEISDLQQVNITQKLPNISRSAELLTDYIERFHKLNVPQKTSSSSMTKDNKKPQSVNTSSTKETEKKPQPNTAEPAIKEPQS